MIGEQISHYRVLERLGRGGMGVVYRAEDVTLGREVALKFLPEGIAEPDAIGRFLREARSAAALNHPHICTIYEVHAEGKQPFIAMELLQGQTLEDLIHRGPAGTPGTHLPIADCLSIARQIAEALEAAHAKNILHRDIKPANIFVTTAGTAKVLDFGLAKSTMPHLAPTGDDDTTIGTNLTVAGSTFGTIAYMSPEQARGLDLDARSDLFSLGLVLYEMATGRQAFHGETTAVIFDGILNRTPPAPSEINAEVPHELERIIGKAIEKDRSLRYQSASEIGADLRRLRRWTDSGEALAVTAVHAPAAGGSTWPSIAAQGSGRTAAAPPRRRFPWIIVGPAIAALVLLAGGMVWYANDTTQALGAGDLILLSDFSNTTGDAMFDGTLKQALAVKLDESPFVNIVSDQRVRETLRFMNQPDAATVTPGLAREICQRQGIKAVMLGDIASLGSSYVLTLTAENCRTGDVLAREQQTAVTKEGVLPALGTAAMTMRNRLGESLASIATLDTPIEQATTSSLEALKAFSLGDDTRNRAGDRDAIPFLRRAIELDPEFALAHARLGTIYSNLGESQRAVEHRTRAYELRERVSERERLYITAHYYSGVTREQDKALETYEVWKQTYPRDAVPHVNSGIIYANRGERERALAAYVRAVELDPTNRFGYLNAIRKYIEFERLEDAQALVQQQIANLGESTETHMRQLEIAAARRDREASAKHAAALENTAAEADMLTLRTAELAYYGRWSEARELGNRAVALYRRQGLPGLVAIVLANQIQSAAYCDETAMVREIADRILAMEDVAVDPKASVAFALAAIGDQRRARQLFSALRPEIAKRNPELDAFVARLFDAHVDLHAGRAAQALSQLKDLKPEGGQGSVANTLLARAEAYRQTGQHAEAIADYRTVLGRPETKGFSPLGPYARLGLARSLAASGDTDAARAEFATLLDIWREADDVPMVREARAEAAKLGR